MDSIAEERDATVSQVELSLDEDKARLNRCHSPCLTRRHPSQKQAPESVWLMMHAWNGVVAAVGYCKLDSY
jgi:hypothetical protein